MWFKIGIKGTEWYNCIELDSEDKHKIVQEWFLGAETWLNPNIVGMAALNYYKNGKYPPLCMVEMMENPPKEWMEDKIKEMDAQLKFIDKHYNNFKELLEK